MKTLSRIALAALACLALAPALKADGGPGVWAMTLEASQAKLGHGTGRLQPLSEGRKVWKTDRVVTAEGGSMQLQLQDGSWFVLHGGSELLMEHLGPSGAEETVLWLKKGLLGVQTDGLRKGYHLTVKAGELGEDIVDVLNARCEVETDKHGAILRVEEGEATIRSVADVNARQVTAGKRTNVNYRRVADISIQEAEEAESMRVRFVDAAGAEVELKKLGPVDLKKVEKAVEKKEAKEEKKKGK